MDIIGNILDYLIKVSKEADAKVALRKIEKEYPGMGKRYEDYLRRKKQLDDEFVVDGQKYYKTNKISTAQGVTTKTKEVTSDVLKWLKNR